MTFAKYLGYRLKRTALRGIIFSIVSLIAVIFKIAQLNDLGNSYHTDKNRVGLYILAAVIGIFATAVPMLETATFKSRRDLDMLYSLPIKRTRLALAHYLCGLIQVVFIYSVTFIGAYAWLSANTDLFDLRPLPLYFALSLILGAVIYSVFIFIFAEANAIIDGIIISALWVFAGGLLLGALMWLCLSFGIFDLLGMTYADYSGYPEMGLIYSPLYCLTLRFERIIEINREAEPIAPEKMLGYVMWALAGICAAFGYFYRMARKSAHKAGEITSSPFGYKTLIPLYGYCLLILMGFSAIFSIFIIAAMVIGYLIMRRGFKFRLTEFIMLGIAVILAFIAAL